MAEWIEEELELEVDYTPPELIETPRDPAVEIDTVGRRDVDLRTRRSGDIDTTGPRGIAIHSRRSAEIPTTGPRGLMIR